MVNGEIRSKSHRYGRPASRDGAGYGELRAAESSHPIPDRTTTAS
jgi:hypothetical protein